MFCPLCREKHQELGPHFASAHEEEIRTRLLNAYDPIFWVGRKAMVYRRAFYRAFRDAFEELLSEV